MGDKLVLVTGEREFAFPLREVQLSGVGTSLSEELRMKSMLLAFVGSASLNLLSTALGEEGEPTLPFSSTF